jgi:hypothetical protein
LRVAELYADGMASADEFAAASCSNNPYAIVIDDGAAVASFDRFDSSAAKLAAKVLLRRGVLSPLPSELLRDVFGNPFRPITVNPSWLAWKDSTVVRLAQAIYDDRAFHNLPVLADTLEHAGCHDADILNHCRGPGPHVLGCWLLDVLLQKQ